MLLYQYSIPVLCCAGISLLIKPYLDVTKGFTHVAKNLFFYIVVCVVSYLLFLPFSKMHREKIKHYFEVAKVRLKK